MKTIIFRADSSPEIGMGHVYRLISLINYLHLEYRCRLFTNNVSILPHEDIQNLNVEIHEISKENIYTTPDQKTKESQIDFDLTHILSGNEIVVLDGYWFGYKYQKSVKVTGAKLVIIDDFANGTFYTDMIINHAPAISKKDYLALPNTAFLLGPEFSILRPSFLSLAKKRDVIKKHEKSLLICFGGSDFFDYTNMILETVSKTDLFNKINVIVGKGYAGAEGLRQNYGDRISLFVGINEQEMASLMADSEIAIVPASTVLYEAIAAQCKVITGYYTENQKMIYEGFLSTGVVVGCSDFKKIAENFSELYEHAQMLRSCDGLIDGLSDIRIKKALQDLVLTQ
jgi:UDP-2,4-diacetamido-2,4,6-trideoxy-beta-L-altropyranose hydrolase